MDPDSASLTWIGLLVSEELVFAIAKLEVKRRKTDKRVEALVRDRFDFMRSFGS
jgi:hypothetical protein|tara:strand:+ start:385 stop:546 length:162 start_codon:yes stop_codon:yes gene_type:complete